ncbi:MAG: polyphosphate kinase 1 [Bacteroidota bacterium]
MRLLPRDFSWLSFNHRVLQEAADKSVPLYERIHFLAIYSSNLDEFYRVRVAALRSFKQLKKATRKAMNIKPKKELKAIQAIVNEQQQIFGRIWRAEILPALAQKGVHLIGQEDYDETQKAFAHQYFAERVSDAIPPLQLQQHSSMPFLENKGLYLLVALDGEQTKLILLEIPSGESPRFVELPNREGQQYITFLDDLIRQELPLLFPNQSIRGAWSVKVSRDAEMYIEDEFSGNLLEKIKQGLHERDVGLPTRFLYDEHMPKDILQLVKQQFELSKHDLVPGARYHNFNDFFGFPDPLANPSWHNEAFPGLPHPALEQTPSLMEALRERDFILHFPYHRFDYVPRFIREAADTPTVDAIKITLYRVASKSAVTEALLYALQKGKKVVTFIEAKARFDEASNLYWGERLQEAGAVVIYSFPGIKVHTKLLLVRQKIAGQDRRYAYIGTGNFNEKTAKIYCDHALMTANPKVVDEVAQVFDLLERKIIVPRTKRVFISPFSTRSGFEKLIDYEIAEALAGRPAHMILKMNSLEDPALIEHLYRASTAGVRIQIIVRGICCLVPGVEGQSENIEVRSIIDRFLEHARVYFFSHGGTEKMYLASADWMTRNLDRRIEVAVPVLDPAIRAELRHIIDLQLNDNTKARRIDEANSNDYLRSENPEVAPIRAQVDTYHWLAQGQTEAKKIV